MYKLFFQKPLKGIDTIYSCRKFFGVPDGAYLSTDSVIDCELDRDVSMNRMEHILGRFEACASDYYSKFKANDEMFKELPLRTMSLLTHNLLKSIDYENVIRKRNENYQILSKHFSDINKLDSVFFSAPYAYPFYYKDGIRLRKKLAEDKIYIAALWNDTLKRNPSELEKDYTENILPLPVDQRYGGEDMDYMISIIEKYI